MLTPPDDLTEAALASALGRLWDMTLGHHRHRPGREPPPSAPYRNRDDKYWKVLHSLIKRISG